MFYKGENYKRATALTWDCLTKYKLLIEYFCQMDITSLVCEIRIPFSEICSLLTPGGVCLAVDEWVGTKEGGLIVD